MTAAPTFKQRLRAWDAARRQRRRRQATGEIEEGITYGQWVALYDTVDGRIRARLRERAQALPRQPLLSVLMPVYNPSPAWLREALDSVRAQAYATWELCIADDRSTDAEVVAVLDEYSRLDPRIRVVHREQNGHISAASNTALELAAGEFIVLLDHDDRLPEHALLCVAETILRFPEAAVVFSDEDKLDATGERCDPFFKSEWNPELFRSYNMVSHLGAYRTALAREVGGFRIGFEGSQDYDLALRCIDATAPERVVHIPHVLYHWRIHEDSTAGGNAVKPYALDAGRRALAAHLQRQGVEATVDADPAGWYVPHYALPAPAPKASVIVIDHGDVASLRRCLRSLAATSYPEFEVIVASTRDTRASMGVARHVRVRRGSPAALANAARAQAQGTILAFVDARCETFDPHWLAHLASYASRADVGLAGAKLVSHEDRIAGGAVIFGVYGSYGLLYRGLGAQEMGYFGRAGLPQALRALDAGCVVVEAARFDAAGGFEPAYASLQAATMDLSLRLGDHGLSNTWVPLVQVRHDAPRGWRKLLARREAKRDWRRLVQRRPDCLEPDPGYSPNLTLTRETFGLAHPPRVGLERPWFEPPPRARAT